MHNKKIKILIAESQELILLGLCKFVENHDSLHTVAITNSLSTVLDLAIVNKPDVILLDLLLNDSDCIEYIPHILNACPQSKILALSNNNDDLAHLDVLRSGVAGIFYKQQSTVLLFKAIKAITIGELWVDRTVTQMLVQSHVNQPINTHSTQTSQLSKRECNIACLASKGLSSKKIAEQLFISDKTVRNNLSTIYGKLAIGSQVELCINLKSFSFCLLDDRSLNRDKCPWNDIK